MPTVLCDFDGTISINDVTDALLEAFGKPCWRELEAEWRAGRMGSRECMTRQIACLDASRDELDAAIDAIGVDEAFAAFVDAVSKRGWELVIVSDGLDYAIERILRRHQLPALPLYANRLLETGARSWRLETPHADVTCSSASGVCKCAFARRAREAGDTVLMVGDGRSDFCVAGCVDLAFAKDSLITHCVEKNLPHIPISGFAEVVDMLAALAEAEALLPEFIRKRKNARSRPAG